MGRHVGRYDRAAVPHTRVDTCSDVFNGRRSVRGMAPQIDDAGRWSDVGRALGRIEARLVRGPCASVPWRTAEERRRTFSERGACKCVWWIWGGVLIEVASLLIRPPRQRSAPGPEEKGEGSVLYCLLWALEIKASSSRVSSSTRGMFSSWR